MLGTWASDIFAYFGGRVLGRRRLAPAISPKKTVEGFVIGVVFGSLAVWWTLYAIVDHVTHAQAIVSASWWRWWRRSATSSSRS